jgi:hypothetical protein
MSSGVERLVEWRERLNGQRESGMSVKDWCLSEGISTATYYYWRKRSSEDQVVGPAPQSAGWVPVIVSEPVPGSHVLTLRVGRVSVEVASGFDASLLSGVLNVLEARC